MPESLSPQMQELMATCEEFARHVLLPSAELEPALARAQIREALVPPACSP